MSKLFSLRFIALFVLLFSTGLVFSQPSKPFRTENGLVTGTQNADAGVRIFKGIPFAAPPVGELRWKAPQPAANWQGVRTCDQFPPSAMQSPPLPFFVWSEEFLAPKEPLSEDCLYLNVWTPASAEKLPVMVWIHGGGFQSGAGACPIYDGEGMAKKGVVFVSINYRLGVFGFFAHPELTLESGNNSSGNYAFLDMIAALHWVQKNIAAFGGDPGRVTIAGQSAGSFAVNALIASPQAKGLFHRAIGESGAMFNDERTATLPEASLAGLALTKKLNASSIAELRKLPAESLLKAGGSYGPVLDGFVLPKDVRSIFSEGKQNDVPLLTGWNRDEGFLFGEPLNAEKYKAQAAERYGKLSEKFLQAYPANDDAEAKQSQKNLMRDQVFAWQNYTWARLQSTTGKAPAWLYRFDRVPPGMPELAEHGAFHSAEIAYALHSLPMWNRPWEPLDPELSETMSSYWANFAANGDPNGKGLPEWRNAEFGMRKAEFGMRKAESADAVAGQQVELTSDVALAQAADEQAKQLNLLVFGEKTGMQGDQMPQNEFDFLDEWYAASTPGLSLYEKALHVSGGDTMAYRILFPENYDRTKKYPLLLFLHGGGEKGNDNEKQLVHGASLFLKPENRKAFPCIVLVPQCPANSSWATVKTDRTKNPPERTFDYKADPNAGLRLAIELTRKIIASEAVDGQRVYVTGLSMGGMGTFEAVGRYPELFAAAAPICGGGDGKAYSEKAAKVPFWIFHGAADAVVDVQLSRDMYARLQALKSEVKYSEYPAVNHNSWDYAFAEEEFLGWLFSKKR